MIRRSLFALPAALSLLAGAMPAPAIEPQLVVTPRAAELPASATNRPFLGAAYTRQPVQLAKAGYVEREYIVSGSASTYEWSGEPAGGEVSVRGAEEPYATRVLVRRPADPAKASGFVVVELLNATPGYDNSPLWSLSWEHFTRRGDVWVGVTVTPAAAGALRKFDAVRYAQVSLASGGASACQSAAAGGAAMDAGADLAWDIIAQVGALLRSSSKENPLWDMQPSKVVAAGYSRMGGYVTTYANALHRVARLGGGAPIYDGFLNGAGAYITIPLGPCTAPLPEDDPRRAALPRDVPFVTAMTESDFNRALPLRRDDSDAQGDYFRLYEIPGASHLGGGLATAYPGDSDLRVAGLSPSQPASCAEPTGDFPAGFAFDAIWQQFADYLLAGQPMANVPRIVTLADGTPQRDAQGNAEGGWRLPQLDLALARYSGRGTPKDGAAAAGQACPLLGAKQAFDAKKLKALYGNRNEYLRRFRAAIDQAVAERRLTVADGEALKNPTVRTLPAF